MRLAPLARPHARIAFARLLQIVGWPGLLGVGLLALSAWVATDAWLMRADVVHTRSSIAALPKPIAKTAMEQPPKTIRLLRREEIPLLLNRVERAATDSGLAFAAADYRFVAATEHQLASLEVRSGFKAPYPKVRATVAALIGSVPGLTFRELTFSRSSVDVADVDAKLTIAVFLADDEAGAAPANAR